MGKKVSKKGKSAAEGGDSTSPFGNPFASLEGLRDSLPAGRKPEQQPAPSSPHRAVVRYELTGRGGKEVTLVEQLGLPEGELRKWVKELKRRLGCGGGVEGVTLVLQGDQRERLPELLRKRGVQQVSVS